MEDKKRYVIVQKDKTPFSQVVNDCETSFCIPVSKGENLNSVVKKLCAFIIARTTSIISPNTRVYNGDLNGNKDGYNAIFTNIEDFANNTTAVFVNGQRMKLNFDYQETNNVTITFMFPINPEDQLIIDYNKK